LLEFRADVFLFSPTNQEKFCDPKYLAIKKLISLLPKQTTEGEKAPQNEKIVEVILSIIGNCTFSNSTAATQVNSS
jgi:hypothetical protein